MRLSEEPASPRALAAICRSAFAPCFLSGRLWAYRLRSHKGYCGDANLLQGLRLGQAPRTDASASTSAPRPRRFCFPLTTLLLLRGDSRCPRPLLSGHGAEELCPGHAPQLFCQQGVCPLALRAVRVHVGLGGPRRSLNACAASPSKHAELPKRTPPEAQLREGS